MKLLLSAVAALLCLPLVGAALIALMRFDPEPESRTSLGVAFVGAFLLAILSPAFLAPFMSHRTPPVRVVFAAGLVAVGVIGIVGYAAIWSELVERRSEWAWVAAAAGLAFFAYVAVACVKLADERSIAGAREATRHRPPN